MAISDVLEIQRMIDLVIRESDGLTHKGLIAEMQYISKHIDKQITDMEKYFDEQADAYERYDNSLVVGAQQ